MYVSARQAAAILGIGRESARRVLASGLAGVPMWETTALLYERSAVEALRSRPEIGLDQIEKWAPDGLVIGRLDPRTGVAAGPWRASVVTQAMVTILTRERGPMPMVTTVGGFVLAGYDVVTAYGPQPGRLLFQLAEPGPWFEQVAHTRVRTPPGNHLLFARTPALSRWEVRRARTPGAAG